MKTRQHCRGLVLFLSALATVMVGLPALAQLHVQDFSTWEHGDSANTTAVWDTSMGEIRLHPFALSFAGRAEAPGWLNDVLVRGNYAYVAAGSSGIEVFDVSNPAYPVMVGLYDTNCEVMGLALAGDYLYAANGGCGLTVIDIGDPANPSEVAFVATHDQAMEVAVSGNVAYVADNDSGLTVVEISNPAAPVRGSHVNTPGTALGVAVDGNYAYVADTYSLQIFDISNAMSPTLVNGWGGGILDVTLDGDYLYASRGAAGLGIVDITDPVNPISLAVYDTDLALDVKVAGDFAYVADDTTGMWVIDVSDPTSPEPFGFFNTPNNVLGVAVAGEFAYLADGADMRIVRVAQTLTTPARAGVWITGTAPCDVKVAGDYAFVANWDSVITVLDIGNLMTPTLAGSYNDAHPFYGIDVAGNYAFAASGTGGLRVLDISDPTDPALVGAPGRFGVSLDVAVDGDYAYVAVSDSGLVVYNVTNPTNPGWVGWYRPAGTVKAVEIDGDRAYITGSDGAGFQVLSVRNPTNPQNLGSDGTVVDGRGIAVAGNVVYVADYDFRLVVYDVSDPSLPTVIGNFPLDVGRLIDVSVVGQRLFVSGRAGFRVLDVTDPTSPIPLGFLGGMVAPAGLDYAGDCVFLTATGHGMQIIQVFERALDLSQARAQSTNVNPIAGVVSRVRLDVDQSCQNGWSVTTTGGLAWQNVSPGSGWVDIPPGDRGSDLRWRAELRYPDYGYVQPPTCTGLVLRWEYTDDDTDGVPNGVDSCPVQNASYFDRDGDGCIDEFFGGRHVEYWADGEDCMFVINEDGAPDIGDGSDIPAIVAGVGEWFHLVGTPLHAFCAGTVPVDTAEALDRVNLITFTDYEYDFGSYALAVGIATSFTTPEYFDGRLYRPGQIVDADMIFNPAKKFKTDTAGSGTDLRSVVTHEAGHWWGLSHTDVRTSTMFMQLPSGTNARSLAMEDDLAFLKAYPSPMAYADGSRLEVTVIEPMTGNPVPGALVFVIETADGDTAACDITLPNGRARFLGIPDGSYYVSIHPLDGTSAVHGLKPSYVNWFVDSVAVTEFVPEYFSGGAESSNDPPESKAPVVVSSEVPRFVEILTNVDTDGPTITATSPEDAEPGVSIHAAVTVSFSEAIDDNTVSGNFRLKKVDTGSGVGGTAYIMLDDSLLSFKAWTPLEYATTYQCSLSVGITDHYDNPMASPYVFTFSTETAPPLSITGIAPDHGAPGSVAVINGWGFDAATPSNNHALFMHRNGTDTLQVLPVAVNPTEIVAKIPQEAASGDVLVRVGAGTSNGLPFTVLSAEEVPRGYAIDEVGLGALPRMVVVAPNGQDAYVATSADVSIVNVNPASPDFLDVAAIGLPGGINGLDITPDGHWVYAVSRPQGELHAIDALTHLLQATLSVHAEPLGIVIEPSGHRAFVPTNTGEIQVWDIRVGSATFRKQVGAIPSPDPNLTGRMAIDPAGDRLLALASTGKLLAFDLGPDTFLVTVDLGIDPEDVVVDPAGERAYVSDGTGLVSVVSLEGLFYVEDITTGGSLRGLDISPAGLLLYAANRELNLIDVIDLDENSPKWREVTTTITQGVNPVDVELTPDGAYAISLLEDTKRLVVTAVGVGPTLKSLSRREGPVGTVFVLAGSGFGTALDSLTVDFAATGGGVVHVAPTRSTGDALTAVVPVTAASGPIAVTRNRGEWQEVSNPLYFTVLSVPVSPQGMRLAAHVDTPDYVAASSGAMSPLGDQLAFGTTQKEIVFVDTDPSSPTYDKLIESVTLPPPGAYDVRSICFTPDGKRVYALIPGARMVGIVDANRASPLYGNYVGQINFDVFWSWAGEIAVSPDGSTLLVSGPVEGELTFVDIVPGSPTENVKVAALQLMELRAVAFHPGGEYAYCASSADNAVYVIDMNPVSPTYREVVEGDTLGTWQPISITFSPDGALAYVLARQTFGGNPYIVTYDTGSPRVPVRLGEVVKGWSTIGPTGGERIRCAPTGDQAVFNARDEGMFNIDLTTASYPTLSSHTSVRHVSRNDFAFTPDGKRLYAVSELDSVVAYDFTVANTLAKLSGDNQTGVVDQPLSTPLRARVTVGGSEPVQGVGVTFTVTSGGGSFAPDNSTTQTAVTNDAGIAEVTWKLGPLVGPQSVRAGAEGLAGSPVTFTATAEADPSTLPLRLLSVSPQGGAVEVSVTTTVLVTFSRSLDTTSVNPATLFLHKNGTPAAVAAAYGFTTAQSRVSLTPAAALDYGTMYVVEITSGLEDASDGPLQNPGTASFITQDAPSPVLSTLSPPAGTETVLLTLSGQGFHTNYLQNKVLFGTVAATPTSGGVSQLTVEVPVDAQSCGISVAVGSDTSNALPFTVLAPSNTAADQVLASAATGAATRSIVVSPDGTMAYAVSPSSDVVVPIDIANGVSLPAIPVGVYPISIDIHPSGKYAYVANFNSGSVSIIDTDPASPGYHTVDTTLAVGKFPIDLAVNADGDRLYVVNLGSTFNLDVIDTDDESANFHSVVATAKAGSATMTVTVSPDGTRLYIGTNDGYIIVEVSGNGYSVVDTVKNGSASKQITVSPDGTLLFVLTTGGEVIIHYLEPGSEDDNSVVATVKQGSGTMQITVSPDGNLLYLIQDEPDIVIVVEIDIIGSVAAIDPEEPFPPIEVEATVIDSIYVGEDPQALAFDPSGSGTAVVTNSGPKTVTILGTRFASLAMPPDTTLAGYKAIPSYELQGFRVRNTSNDAHRYQYLVTTEGPAVFTPGQDPSALSGTTSVVAPGDSFAPPAALLDIPPVGESSDVRVVYRVSPVENRAMSKSDTTTITLLAPTAVEDEIPRELALFQNYPNPFNPTTTIVFALPEKDRVNLTIYNVEGKRVVTLINDVVGEGYRRIVWNGRDERGNPVSSGVYFYRLATANKTFTRKMVLIR